MKPPTSGPIAAAIAAPGPSRGGDRRRGADERVGAPLHGALEVPVDQRLHRGKEERRAEAADDRPEDDDRQQALRQRHRESTGRVAQQPEHVRALATHQIADLAPDQDERRRHERFQRDRRLHTAGGRVEIVHDRRNRDVHQRRVDDQHKHRHRKQDREPHVAARLLHRHALRFHAQRLTASLDNHGIHGSANRHHRRRAGLALSNPRPRRRRRQPGSFHAGARVRAGEDRAPPLALTVPVTSPAAARYRGAAFVRPPRSAHD
jgi:hypothetical protein